MRTRSRIVLDIVLVALVVVLGLIAYFQPGLQKPSPVPQLTPLSTDTVRRMELIYPDGHTVILEKEKDTWFLRKPIEVEANRFQAETLAETAAASSLAQYPASQVDLAQLRLDKPLLKVRFNDQEVAFGDTEPLTGRRYALYRGTVHLISDSIAGALNADTTHFVSYALLPEGVHPVLIRFPDIPENADTIQSTQGEKELRFERDRWVLTPPDSSVSQDAINQLVDGWRYAHALRVEPFKGEQKPLAAVTIQLQGVSQPIRFDILSLKPELVLARPDLGLKYYIAESLAERLLHPHPPKKKHD